MALCKTDDCVGQLEIVKKYLVKLYLSYMRKYLSPLAVISSLIIFISCSATRNQTPSVIGLVPLQGYSTVGNKSVQDTTYMAIQNEIDFANAFSPMTASVKKPDFNGQIVVALLLKSPASMRFQGADFIGSQINIRIQSCKAPALPDCNTSSLFLATIPKVGSSKRVQFIIDSTASGNVTL